MSFSADISFFSSSHWAFKRSNCSLSSESSLLSFSSLALEAESVSFLRASLSISSWSTLLLISSISAGIESISVLIIAEASSIRSMALSGRKRSDIYLSDRVAAAITAPSDILMPWWISYFSLSPLSIEIVSSTVGSVTRTFWNLLSRAASFSIYFLYSSSVVAPIV